MPANTLHPGDNARRHAPWLENMSPTPTNTQDGHADSDDLRITSPRSRSQRHDEENLWDKSLSEVLGTRPARPSRARTEGINTSTEETQIPTGNSHGCRHGSTWEKSLSEVLGTRPARAARTQADVNASRATEEADVNTAQGPKNLHSSNRHSKNTWDQSLSETLSARPSRQPRVRSDSNASTEETQNHINNASRFTNRAPRFPCAEDLGFPSGDLRVALGPAGGRGQQRRRWEDRERRIEERIRELDAQLRTSSETLRLPVNGELRDGAHEASQDSTAERVDKRHDDVTTGSNYCQENETVHYEHGHVVGRRQQSTIDDWGGDLGSVLATANRRERRHVHRNGGANDHSDSYNGAGDAGEAEMEQTHTQTQTESLRRRKKLTARELGFQAEDCEYDAFVYVCVCVYVHDFLCCSTCACVVCMTCTPKTKGL
jgi:hypothetical protein